MPLPLFYGAAGNRVRTQNQVLAPCRVDASTTIPRVGRLSPFAADDEIIRERRAHRQGAYTTHHRQLHTLPPKYTFELLAYGIYPNSIV
jgi:hypothetical protein